MDIQDNIVSIYDFLSNDIKDVSKKVKENKNDIENLLISTADAVYARRCDEHVMVYEDCPKNIKGRFGVFLYGLKYGKRCIPPYCRQWCDLMNEPTASLKE